MFGLQDVSILQLELEIFVYRPNMQNVKLNIINRSIEYLKYEKNKGNPTPKKES